MKVKFTSFQVNPMSHDYFNELLIHHFIPLHESWTNNNILYHFMNAYWLKTLKLPQTDQILAKIQANRSFSIAC